ncbi:rRNA maturation RNase YbeY [Candidatus Fermentibacteria bacterium]|nr:MAG: rRNA maturation RNase YbeY [Candidatus Fermentibacteria bacterium]
MADISVILENPGFSAEDLQSLTENLLEGSVEVVLTDPGYMRVINRNYRHIDRATDVLSFDLSLGEEDMPDGTIYVDGRLFPPIEALLERIFHGYLHLKGYSHNNEKDTAIMNREVNSLVAHAIGKQVGN